MSQFHRPIIVGAGPVGLGAALFLAQHGRAARVVEERNEPVQQSKALAINPRTLEILESSGLTRQLLERGMPVRGVHFHRGGRVVAKLSLENIHRRYPFMLALSQATTERLLARALEEAGGTVERGRRLVACRNLEGQVEATLEATTGGTREVATTPWLLAADGARSTAREQLGIDFVGSSLPEPWHLADVPLRTTLADNLGHVFFFDGGGFLFLIRVIDENLHDAPATRWWRVIANQPEPLSRLVQAEVAGPAVWTSSFHIAHRINKSFRVGGVYFAGDAAHIHSPLGARGMNLGLEDAWVFAQLERTGRLDQYDRLRRSLDGQVVRRVEFLSRMAAGETWFFRLVRSVVLPTALTVRFARTLFMRTVTGLDYELPREAVVAPGQAGGKAA